MVHPASRRIPRVRRYSRKNATPRTQPSPTGLSPPPVARSSGLRLTASLGRRAGRPLRIPRSTPQRHRRPPLPPLGFGLLPVRSPLLGESSRFLRVLRCFSSPGALPDKQGAGVSPPAGCPIRVPPDRRLPAPPRGVSSRGHALLRPAAPRHPPCARLCGHAPPWPKPRRVRTSCPRLHATQHTYTHLLLPHALPHAAAVARDALAARVSSGAVRAAGGRLPPGRSRGGRPPARLVVKVRLDAASGQSPVPGHPGDRWSHGGSNPEPPPCKGGALPVELRPPAAARRRMPHPGFPRGRVGAPGLEPGASALSGPRSDRLSYAPARWLTARARDGSLIPPDRRSDRWPRAGNRAEDGARGTNSVPAGRDVTRDRPPPFPYCGWALPPALGGIPPVGACAPEPGCLPHPHGGPAARSTPANGGSEPDPVPARTQLSHGVAPAPRVPA